MSKGKGYFSTLPIRFFVIDYDSEEVDLIEVDEYAFLKAEGNITYERHTVRENGCSQICLTKMPRC